MTPEQINNIRHAAAVGLITRAVVMFGLSYMLHDRGQTWLSGLVCGGALVIATEGVMSL